MPEEENKEDKSSAYNEAVKKIDRLARLQEGANLCAKEGDWNGWYGNLTILYLEISSKLNDTEIQDVEKDIIVCNKALIVYNNVADARDQGLRIQQTFSPTNKKNIYNLLFRLDFKIRKLVDKSGYGSPDKEDELF